MQTNYASTTTYFVGNHYEVTGTEVTKYYYAGTQRIAMRKNGILNYIIGDHLGSTSLVTDAAGNVVSQQQYKAWGEERYSSGIKQTSYGYTGQYSYTYINLLDYGSRRYDPELGRFIQPDSIVPDPSNPQAYDRYSYVFNNPVKYVDPSGHKPCDGDFDEKGHCDDSNYKLLDLLDYVEGEIVNENGKIRAKYTSLSAMLAVLRKAASIYGRDWNGFLDATTYHYNDVSHYYDILNITTTFWSETVLQSVVYHAGICDANGRLHSFAADDS